jgi:glycosyltransferase involved in cell wall biosynthesis
LRILYLTESMRWSGGAEQLLAMACALRDRGHEIIIGCQPQSDILERARAANLAVEPIRMRQDYDLPAAWQVAQVLRRNRIELLHAQHSTAHALGLVAAHWAKIPAFTVTRRVMFPLRKNLFSRLKYRSSRINGYVAITNAVKEELVKGGVDPKRIEVIQSIVHRAPLSRAEGQSLRNELGIPADSPLVLNVANYADFKGQDLLMEAAVEVLKRHPKARFVFAGRDTEQLKALADRLQIASQVVLAGFRTDVPRFLAAADLFVLPSRQEAAGTALREAMLAGLPVIGSRAGGIPESILHEKTGLLVPPGDAGSLAAAIIRVLDNPALAKDLADAGRSFCEAEFSLSAAAQRMELFYRRLLNGHSS